MTVLEQIRSFTQKYQKEISVEGISWRYYRLGTGAPLLWLTGGLRRAALGFVFMEKLAARHTVIAPDYPPVMSIEAFLGAFDAILGAESADSFALGGQSYGGLLAQAYLARRLGAVRCMLLSSSGPADYGAGWLLADDLAIALAKILPEKRVKAMLAGGLLKAIPLPEAERAEWRAAVETLMQTEITRADVISHFAVAADLIRKKIVAPGVYRDWQGRICVMSAENDPTQSKQDLPRYLRLFGRPVEVFSLGQMGHAAALFNPDRYVELLEQALS